MKEQNEYYQTTIPILTNEQYINCIPFNPKLYTITIDLNTFFRKEEITIEMIKTIKALLTHENLMKFDYMTIRSLISFLKEIKPIDQDKYNPLFKEGVELLIKIFRYQCTQEIIQETITFYNDLSPTHSAVFIDEMRSKSSQSAIYYAFDGIASFISASIKIDKIPTDCYTIHTYVRLKSLHEDALPCIFSFNANNYFFSVSVNGETHMLELHVNILSSNQPMHSSHGSHSPHPMSRNASPSISHVKSTYSTGIQIKVKEWYSISLVHFRERNMMKLIVNETNSQEFEVPYLTMKQNQAIVTIGGLDGKSYSYLNGDIGFISWYFDQVTPTGVPTLLISPTNYATLPSKSCVKPLTKIKNRIQSKEIQIVDNTITSVNF